MPVPTNAGVVEALRERESALYFPVSIRPLSEITNVSTGNTNFQAVTRDDTNELLAVHRGAYRLQKNEDVMQVFESTLGDSEIDMREVQVADSISYNGGRVVRDYRFPSHTVDIGDGDRVSLQLRVQNSYDGSCRFSMLLGAFRFVCSNGLVVGDTMAESKSKHTSGLSIESIASDVRRALDVFAHQSDQWTMWKNTPCPLGIADNVIEAIPGISQVSREEIMGAFQRDAANDGATIWTLYNAMTYWSTHTPVRETSEANRATIVLEREGKIRKVLNHPVFSMAA